jgi:peptidyl-prolyl cis-trans isomerase SurA
MIKQLLVLLAVLILPLTMVQGQKKDPVLFTVEGNPVHVSEFNYIYTKTNGKDANFSRASLEEYLDLYVKFKLKVQKARDMKLDTIPSLQRELEGYRRQLANSYLIDKEVTDKLVREAYERMQKDVEVKHILFATQPNATAADTVAPYNRAMEALEKLSNGASFEQLASEISDDKNSRQNGGTIGYITAMLPSGFYDLETLIYKLKPGEYGGPVRTKLGYHLVKVNSVRPARGEMEAAHILIRKSKDRSDEESKRLIDSIYQALERGTVFESLASAKSEDKQSAKKGGYIGTFGINRYEKGFEDAAFALKKNAQYTKPVETSIGWHIIRRVGKREMDSFDRERRRLQALVQRDSRHERAKEAMVERIKRDNNYQLRNSVYQEFVDSLSKDFLSYKWEMPKMDGNQTLFSLGKQNYSLESFSKYCKRSTRTRLRSGTADPVEVAGILFKDYLSESCLQFEELQLEVKYPEFKALMREYEEGILLFEATKILVWDKASQDTTGLKAFFPEVKGKYQWKERAEVVEFILKPEAADRIESVRKMAAKKPVEKVLSKFNKGDQNILSVNNQTFEKGKNEELDAIKWTVGAMTDTRTEKRDRSLRFMKIKSLTPSTDKTLEEARGYIIADYQDYLEKQWVKELKDTYKVNVKKDVLKTLIRE